MLATSIRHPSSEYGGRSHFATTDISSDTNRPRSSSLAQLNFGRVGSPSHEAYVSFRSSWK